MRKDYYAAHVSQNLPHLDIDTATNGCAMIAHIAQINGEARV